MRFLLLIFTCLLYVLPPALADSRKANVPFRQDAGLISAEYYLAQERYAEAIDITGIVLSRHPKSADAYTYRGYAYMKLGDAKKAAADFSRALTLDPQHLGANKYRAELYLAEKDLTRALEQMQVLRMTCAGRDCEELMELQRDINAFKKSSEDTGQ